MTESGQAMTNEARIRLLEQQVARLAADRVGKSRPVLAARLVVLPILTVAFAAGLFLFLQRAESQAIWWPDGFNVFRAGDPARAEEVNENFKFLVDKIGIDPADLAISGDADLDGDLSAASGSFSGSVSAGGDLSVSGTLLLGEMEVGGARPLELRRYTGIGRTTINAGYDTAYPVDTWSAAVVGVDISNSDWNEGDAGKLLEVRMIRDAGTWRIRASVRTHNNAGEIWAVDVLFIRNELVTATGY
jgi:hypothetical protein